MKFDMIDQAEQAVRDILHAATAGLPEAPAGFLFAVGVVLTDHLFRLAR